MAKADERLQQLIQETTPWLREIRRKLHANPELGFSEVATTDLIEESLRQSGINSIHRLTPTGLIADIGTGESPSIALRADIDALTVLEENDVPYKSSREGIMHACGHDGHTAILLGVAKVIGGFRERFKGTLRLIFQPSEEGPVYGAPKIIEQGVLLNPHIDEVYALHLFPSLRQGHIAIRPGFMLAGADSLVIRVIGRGGHGGVPHETVDAITIAAQVVSGLQQVISRQISPSSQAVLSIGTIEGGTRRSAIAPSVKMTGTLRTFDPRVRSLILKSISSIVEHTCLAFGAQSECHSERLVKPVVNSLGPVERVTRAVAAALGPGALTELDEPLTICEDFSFYLDQGPGAYMLLGCRPSDDSPVRPLHSPIFDFDEECLAYGVATLARIALDFFEIP